MRGKTLILLAITALAGFPPQAQAAPILGAADSYAVLAGSTVTNTGGTTVEGDLGVYPGLAVVGFPPGIVTPPGTIHAGDAHAQAAQNSLTTAYNALAGLAYTVDLTGQDLGGMVLTPGIYHFSSSAQLTGTLTLNAQGMNDAFWVFQIGSTLTTASSSVVNMINLGSNAGADNGLYWQVGSSATLGTGSTFEGNILALTSITIETGATLHNARALARNGAVTLDTNTISIFSPFPFAPGSTLNGGLEFNDQGQLVPTGGSNQGEPLPTGTPVPEPSTYLIFGAGLAGLFCFRKRFLSAGSPDLDGLRFV